ncbi:hypothetical protein MJD09_13595 [bacterium]|nr:hypothetical protein [bacterium]
MIGKKTVDFDNWPFDALPEQFCNSTDVMAVAQKESQVFRAEFQDF